MLGRSLLGALLLCFGEPTAALWATAPASSRAQAALLAPVSRRRASSVSASALGSSTRRALLSTAAAAAAGSVAGAPAPAHASFEGAQWKLWPALPLAPYGRRKTVRRQVGAGVWAFEQLLGVFYVHVPIRMTVIALESGGLFVYAPVAPTKECLSLLQPLIDEHGPVRYIVLPSVAPEHKVLAGPFARAFPDAAFYACDQQYSFPLTLPSLFLGLPRWTKPLPRSSGELAELWPGGEVAHGAASSAAARRSFSEPLPYCSIQFCSFSASGRR